MTDAARKQRRSVARRSLISEPAWCRRVREAAAQVLRDLSAPLVRWIAKHQVKARRFGGFGSLALGVAFMAGGLGPLGLALIFAGTAVLMVELEPGRRPPSDGTSK